MLEVVCGLWYGVVVVGGTVVVDSCAHLCHYPPQSVIFLLNLLTDLLPIWPLCQTLTQL